jgi:ribosomal protein L7/L12
MSVVKLNEYASTTYRSEQSRILAERTQALINISKKAREESLTLQETNDLYAEFNKTYDLSTNAIVASKKIESDTKPKSLTNVDQAVSVIKKVSVIKAVEQLKTVGLDGVDESWAIKLLKESELEESVSSLQGKQSNKRVMIEPVLCEA